MDMNGLIIITITMNVEWVPINLTGKISDGCIIDLGFNRRLHQKLIGILVC